jgi:formylglycine-generating enzyme required for sulfatase activity
MGETVRTIDVLLRGYLRRLDRMPPVAAAGAGLAVAAMAVGLLAVAPVAGSAVFAFLLAVALGLAFSAEPIAIPLPTDDREKAQPERSVAAPAPKPPRVQGDPDEPLLTWVSIPAGSFAMGSDEVTREQPIHQVTVSAFESMSVPVTRRLYKAVMGDDPSSTSGEADSRPVTNVSWSDAVAFCNRWSERSGLSPCYQVDGTLVTLERNANGYRLLTEAEWEYACRAGSTGKWCFGDDEAQLGDYAWYFDNSGNETHPVRQKKPNTWGLYDMHGNVREWVGNWYGPYPRQPQTDPAGPNTGQYRVLRGGAFDYGPRYLRSAIRGKSEPELWDRFIGFRCARSPAASLAS